MRLTELDAVLKDDAVRFRCPRCRTDWVRVPWTGPVTWERSGDSLDTLTLRPSVNFTHVLPDSVVGHPVRCNWHGWVTNDEAVDA